MRDGEMCPIHDSWVNELNGESTLQGHSRLCLSLRPPTRSFFGRWSNCSQIGEDKGGMPTCQAASSARTKGGSQINERPTRYAWNVRSGRPVSTVVGEGGMHSRALTWAGVCAPRRVRRSARVRRAGGGGAGGGLRTRCSGGPEAETLR